MVLSSQYMNTNRNIINIDKTNLIKIDKIKFYPITTLKFTENPTFKLFVNCQINDLCFRLKFSFYIFVSNSFYSFFILFLYRYFNGLRLHFSLHTSNTPQVWWR